MYRIMAILLCFIMVACTNTTKYGNLIDKWKGASSADLIKVWGAPTDIVNLPGGHTNYLYHTVRVLKEPDRINPSRVTVVNQAGKPSVITTSADIIPGGTYRLTCAATFELDQHNKIVDVHAEGNDCD